MTNDELLEKVKTALNITGNYHDESLKIYINECIDFLRFAGVPEDILKSTSIIGVVCRGVTDLWNYGAGEGKLSEYFCQRATQLAYGKGVQTNV